MGLRFKHLTFVKSRSSLFGGREEKSFDCNILQHLFEIFEITSVVFLINVAYTTASTHDESVEHLKFVLFAFAQKKGS